MIDLFIKGGPVMWPLLILACWSVYICLDRCIFLIKEKRTRDSHAVLTILRNVELGDIATAIESSKFSNDLVARVLVYGLSNRSQLERSLIYAGNREIKRFGKGVCSLESIIAVSPLLGLFGTIIGLITAFSALANVETSVSGLIASGVSQGLICSGFGLGIAIAGVIPFNYFNHRIDELRFEIEDSASALETMVRVSGANNGEVT